MNLVLYLVLGVLRLKSTYTSRYDIDECQVVFTVLQNLGNYIDKQT